MFRAAGGLRWLLSTRPIPYGKPVLVLLWLYNPGDVQRSVMTCSDIGWFWSSGIEIVDSAGHPVLSRQEEQERNAPDQGGRTIEHLMTCARNFAIFVPPHACLHTSFSEAGFDLPRDLATRYDLPPRQYFIVPREEALDAHSRTHALRNLKNRVSLTILPQ